jgi:phosphoribosylformimino-5-aminoimidazole carboxamide ribotide isomerase
MIIFPAIDIREGKCVRLTRGDFSTAEQVAFDPLETAIGFRAAGAEWIHMVDLDGAQHGRRMNADIFIDIAKKSGLRVQLGGGIRDMESLEYYFAGDINRAVLGTAALLDPGFLQDAVETFGERIAVGIDALEGTVRLAGWTIESKVDYLELAKKMEAIGVRTIVFTDISRDGTLSGPAFERLENLKQSVSCDIIASGGVSTIDDIRTLTDMGYYGAIIGKAIYKGTVDLHQAIQIDRDFL